MRKYAIILVLCLVLSGCSRQVPFETLGSIREPERPPAQVVLTLPEEASAQVLSRQNREKIYSCGAFDIFLSTQPAGDLNAALREITGLDPEALTVLHTEKQQIDRCDFVWSSAGETGSLVGRGAILDDGAYQYCLSVLCPQEAAQRLEPKWNALFQSFSLGS